MRILLSILFSLAFLSSDAQSKDTWNTLSSVLKESRFDDMMGMEVIKAVPLPPAQKLDGEEIMVTGYMISLSAKIEKQAHFMFSRYPQNMCFFCGAAGPESAMQVFMKNGEKVMFKKEKVKLKGVLQIQENDASGLIYFLNEAEIIRS